MKFRYQDTIFPQTLSTHCLFICKPLNMWTREPLRQGETCFLNSEMPKKIHACPSINKSTKGRPRVPYYSPPYFRHHCMQPVLLPGSYPSPYIGLGMRSKLPSTLFHSEIVTRSVLVEEEEWLYRNPFKNWASTLTISFLEWASLSPAVGKREGSLRSFASATPGFNYACELRH